jgi:hypothetical protein
MFDSMFEAQTIDSQVFRSKVTGVAACNGTLLPFQSQNMLGGQSVPHGREAVLFFGMVPVNNY